MCFTAGTAAIAQTATSGRASAGAGRGTCGRGRSLMAETIVPVKIRTARKQHACDDCPEPIMPGDKYELHVTPPHRLDVWDSDHWLTYRTHWPRRPDPQRFLLGCAEAAAYREQAERNARA